MEMNSNSTFVSGPQNHNIERKKNHRIYIVCFHLCKTQNHTKLTDYLNKEMIKKKKKQDSREGLPQVGGGANESKAHTGASWVLGMSIF